jgi:hypothetical protein
MGNVREKGARGRATATAERSRPGTGSGVYRTIDASKQKKAVSKETAF